MAPAPSERRAINRPVLITPDRVRVKSLDRDRARRGSHRLGLRRTRDLRKGFDALLADRQRLEGPRVQDVESPAHVERLPQPARARRPRVQVKPGRLVSRSQRPDGIVGDRWRERDGGQKSSVRSPKP